MRNKGDKAMAIEISGAVSEAEKKAEKAGAKKPVQAYIFIGVQRYGKEEPQAMRRRFMAFSRMYRENGSSVSQNRFGLMIVSEYLDKFEAEARKQLKGQYEAVVEKHWKDAQAEDKARQAKADARTSKKGGNGGKK